MKIVLQTKSGEHTLNIDGEKAKNNLKKAGAVTGNTVLLGINSMFSGIQRGMKKVAEATEPSPDYMKAREEKAVAKAKLEAEIAKKKAEIKKMEAEG